MSVPTLMAESCSLYKTRKAFPPAIILHIWTENTKRNKSGDAILKICVHVLDTTVSETVTNMESGLENICIAYRILILRYIRYTYIHIYYMWGGDKFSTVC